MSHNTLYCISFVLAGAGVLVLNSPTFERYLKKGPMNTGHDSISCDKCHKAAEGTHRQQLQANAAYLLQQRRHTADFGKKTVTNEHCLECHNRPNERHPVYRFFEPRFAEARKEIQPQFCNSCHQEHSGVRITVKEPGFCQHCHEDTELKKDPISISHKDLIADKKWQSCLGCHDFHGNHKMKTKQKVSQAFSSDTIYGYFSGAKSPYSDSKIYPAKKDELYDK